MTRRQPARSMLKKRVNLGGLLRRPATWAVLYFMVMMTFAFVYSRMPGHFSQATLQAEKSVLRSDIIGAQTSLERFLQKYRAAKIAPQTNLSVVIGSITSEGIQVYIEWWASDRTTVAAWAGRLIPLDRDWYDYPRECPLFETPNPRDNAYSEVGLPKDRLCQFKLESGKVPWYHAENDPLPRLFAIVPPATRGVSDVSWSWPHLDIPYDDGGRELSSLVSTVEGDPVAASGSIWRMLYFSAVTITTLGYGDIAPVTSRARGLVTVEVVLGVFCAGAFFWRLTSGISQTKGSTI